ncbi:MAG: S1/P1 nuclease [Lysobacterales bacterium]
MIGVTKTLNLSSIRWLLITAAAAMLLTVSGSVLAWGTTGHRVTGMIAEQHLSGYARARVQMILGGETLAQASTWADFMRSNPSKFWQKTSAPWHYVTVPEGETYSDVGAPPQGDALTAIKRFTAVLQDPDTSLDDQQLALRFLVHVIGDLHQPLHAGNGTDRGGNDFAVTYAGRRSNLHSVWDNGLIDKQKLSYTEWVQWLAPKITPQNVVQWWNVDPEEWIKESTALRDGLYPEERDLGFRYDYQHIATVHTQLSKAGIRLAAYLNSVLAP